MNKSTYGSNPPEFSLTTAEQEKLETLRTQLATLEAQYEKKSAAHITGTQMNPAGDIGSIRSRSKRQKQHIMNRYDREARETVQFVNKIQELKKQITNLEGLAERRKKRFKADMMRLKVWDALKVGDTFQPGNNPLQIKKKNRFSVITTSGTKWKITEVIGLSRQRIDELRKYMN